MVVVGHILVDLVGSVIRVLLLLSLESLKFSGLAGWEEKCIPMFVNLPYFSKARRRRDGAVSDLRAT